MIIITYTDRCKNEKDFYNLMSVYLDATLFPRLMEMDFKQEGHRLEFDEPTGTFDFYFSHSIRQKFRAKD
jgi:Zn-dependent M16 (insulinase) family peptidase